MILIMVYENGQVKHFLDSTDEEIKNQERLCPTTGL